MLSLPGDAVIAHCSLGLRSGRLRGAVFHNARSLRWAHKRFSRSISNRCQASRRHLPGLRRSETVPTLFSRTDSGLLCPRCDHLRRPRCAFGRSDPTLPTRKPDAPLRVRRSSRDRAHPRGLTRPQSQVVAANDEFQTARSDSSQKGICDCAAQMLFNRVSQRTCAKSRMKAALHKERNDGMAECELEAFVAKKRQFPRDMQTCDLHLHIIVQAIEDFSVIRA